MVTAAAEEYPLESTSVPCLSFFGSGFGACCSTHATLVRSIARRPARRASEARAAGQAHDGRRPGRHEQSFSASKALVSTNDLYRPRLRISSGHHGRCSCHCVYFLCHGRPILTTCPFLFPVCSCGRTTLRSPRTPPPASSLSPPARLSPELHPPAPLRCAPQLPLAHLSHHLPVCSTCRSDIHQSLGRLDLSRPGGAH